ncbi:Patatin-like protein 8 [Cardamine amara subsp. amara]|uniref:Patatin n=1 Tax=Cardamine amara subsp. amara TaxID=228776 RepID=A0ABD1AWG9_CARAN
MNRRYDKPPPLAVSSKGKKKHFVNHTAPNTPGHYERTQTSPTLSTTRSHEPIIDSDDKLSYEIFSILESKFLFGYEDPRLLWIPRSPLRPGDSEAGPSPRSPLTPNGVVLPGTPSSSFRSPRGRICVLSIDGGGMRGLLAGKSLIYLEQMLKEKSGDPNARIADYFDVAAGSGVGGVFSAMMFATRDGNRPIFKAEDTWKFLVENAEGFYRSGGGGGGGAGAAIKRVIRSGSGSSSSSVTAATAKLEKAMKASFADLTLKDTLKPILISCYDLSSTAPFLFSRADALESDSFDFRLRDICRATWAEPGTFDPVRTCSVDGKTRCVAVGGGLAMSNPTAAAITHVFHNKQEFPAVKGVEDLLVLSLGTGQLFEVNYDYEQVKNWRVKEWARPMARISGDGSAEFVDQAVAMGFGPYRSSNYVRIQQANGSRLGACGPNVDTDPRAENVKKLTEIADEMLKQNNVESVLFGSKRIGEMSNSEKLEWFACELVIEQQRRSVRASPTVTLKQAVSKTNRNAINATLTLISKDR